MKFTKDFVLDCAGKIAEGILAGIMISLGGAVFLACYPQAPIGKYIGSFLFPLALICICMRGYALYTGKIGLLYEKHSKDDVSMLLLCLLGNAIGTVACGYLIAFALPSLKQTALELCTGKLAMAEGGKLYLIGFLRAILCGILVFLSVDIYRNNGNKIVGIVFCIPAFILSGYEHSIADMFYFAASGIATWQAFGFLVMIVLGNSVGGLLVPTLRLRPKKREQRNSIEAQANVTQPKDIAPEQESAA